MNRIMLTLSALLLPMLIHSATSQKTLERTITGIHTKLFAVDNLFNSYLKAQEWNAVMEETYNFVKEHHDSVENQRDKSIKSSLLSIRSSTVSRNKMIMQNYELIESASNELVETIHEAYVQVTLPRQIPMTKQEMDKFSKKFASLEKRMNTVDNNIKNELSAVQKAIKKETSPTKKSILKEQEGVFMVLHRIALTLELTAKKAGNDLRK